MKQENQLTLTQVKAAAKVAADLLTNKEIATSLGISERSLERCPSSTGKETLCDRYGRLFVKQQQPDCAGGTAG
jgi:FixJ family two-component response regulator